jgi:hypothetical protein
VWERWGEPRKAGFLEKWVFEASEVEDRLIGKQAWARIGLEILSNPYVNLVLTLERNGHD